MHLKMHKTCNNYSTCTVYGVYGVTNYGTVLALGGDGALRYTAYTVSSWPEAAPTRRGGRGGFFSFCPFQKSYATYTAARLHGPLHVSDMRGTSCGPVESSAQQRTHSVVISRQVDSALARGIRHLKERL